MSKIFYTLIFLFALGQTVKSQTTIISPTGDGGFETGDGSFAANGWTVVNGSVTNQWYTGAVPTGFTGNAAYISGNSGAAWTYTNGSISVAHFYRDVIIPAGETNVTLSFDWNARGESGFWDALLVGLCPTSVTPQATTTSLGTGLPADIVNIGQFWTNAATATQNAVINIPSGALGNCSAPVTVRLVFTWKNDGGGGSSPPAGVDNISLTSSVPPSGRLTSAGGVFTINSALPNTGTNFTTFTEAIESLNLLSGCSVPTGSFTFNVQQGQTFQEILPALIFSGTSSFPIVFQKTGTGPNPKIERTDAGILTTSTFGGHGDGVLVIQGSDYVTFDGIDLAASNAGIEYGLLLRKNSGEDGCKFVTYKNGNVTLTRPTSGTPYTTGIYISNLLANSPVSSSTGVTVTNTNGRHENILITGNTISNVFYGVQARGYAHGSAPYNLYDTAVYIGQPGAGNGNIINNFGGLSTTAVYGIFFLQVKDAVASHNIINNTDNGGVASTGTIYGIYGSTSTTGMLTAANNKIELTSAYTSGSIYGIYNSAFTGDLNINNDTVTIHNSASTSGTVAHIYNSSATAATSVNISNNILGNSTYTSTGTCYVIYNSVTNAALVTVNNNEVTGITKTGSSTLYVYYDLASPTGNEVFANNKIYGISNAASNLYGYYSNTTAAHQHNVYGNSVYGLSCGGITYALYKGGGRSNIYKNKIYDITNTATGSIVAGIYITSGVQDSVYNNIIGDLNATAYSGTNGVAGIYSSSTSANSTIGIYYNTIVLNASSSGTNFGTSGIYLAGSTTATTAVAELKNNLVVNNSTAAGTGKTIALRRSSTSLANFASGTNNNLYYSSGSVFFDGTNEDPDIAAYKSRVTPGETASISELPVFVSITGSDPAYLHIDPATATQIESGGNPVADIIDDFDGNTRNVTNPDIGADEFSGISTDLTGPSIIYTALPVKTLCTVAPTITAIITDPSGIKTVAGTKPRLWFKRAGELDVLPATNTSVSNGWKYVEASNSASPFEFTFDFSLLTSPLTGGDSVSYFIVAQDLAAIPNVGVSTATFANSPASVALSASTFPVSGNINGFSILIQPNPVSIKTSRTELCVSGTVNLDIDGVDVTGGEFQWQSSPAGANAWADISGATTVPYTTNVIAANTDFRLIVKCGGTPITGSPSNVVTVIINNPQVVSTIPGNRCGPGTVILGGTGSTGSTLSWYDVATGGSSLGSGASFTTPALTGTTTFYTTAEITSTTPNTIQVGSGASTSSSYESPYYYLYGGKTSQYLFRASELMAAGLSAGNISSIAFDVVAANSSFNNFAISMKMTSASAMTTTLETGLTPIYSNASVSPVVGINIYDFSTSPFYWDGVSNLIVQVCWSNNNTGGTSTTVRYDATSFVSNGYYRADNQAPSVICGAASGTSTTSSRPKTLFGYFPVCQSSRVPVIATINTPPTITASATQATVCAGQPTQLNVSSPNAGYTYSWNPGNLAGASQTVSPAANTTYTVTATDNSGGPSDGCANTADVSITVNPLPSAVTITPASTTICTGSAAQLLTASGGEMSGIIAFNENFNGTAAGWTTVNNSTGGTPANAAWTLRADGYTYGTTPVTFHSDDNSQFYLSNSDAPGSGSVTSTILQSPVFSLASFSTANLNFWHFYRVSSAPESINVEISADGTNWNMLQSYTTAQGAANGFVNVNINLDAYAGEPTVSLRFRYEASWDWYWAIDNVSVTGSQATNITWSPVTDLFTDAAATIPYTGTATATVYAKPSANTTYTASAINGFNCTASNSVAVTITTPPAATISYAGSPYCNLAGTATVTQTGTTGGTYSSTTGLVINTTNGELDLGGSTPGTYTVTYTVAANGGCSQFQTTASVTINAPPSATILYPASPYCTGGGIATVTHTGTTGGTYSSTTGLSIDGTTGEITLATSTPGIYTVTYTIAASGGCPVYTTTAQVTISNSPSATISYAGSPYCSSGTTAAVTQTGSVGGVYSSTTGLSIDGATGEINIATSTPGTYTVTYFIAAANGCTSFSTTTNVTITPAPVAMISYAGSPYCSNGTTATVTQTGTNGGTYSSTTGLSIDATTGTIDLAASTAGTYTVTYTVAAANGCAIYTTTTNVAITAAPSANISYAGSPYCGNGTSAAVTRTGTSGGTYSSTTGLSIDASTGTITLGTSTPGTYTVTYSVAAANGCAAYSTTTNVTVIAAPSATISYAGSPYCSSGTSATVTHTGTTGGTYSSTSGLSIDPATGAIDLAASTVGTYTVTYTIVASGCPVYTTSASVTITTLPSATISYVGSPYCGNGATANVTRTGTTGGTYSSTTGLTINPSTGAITLGTSTPGTYTVTYSVAAANGCAAVSTTTNVTVTAAPIATISYAGSPYCSNGTTATVTQTGTTGGAYSSTTGLSINSTTGAINLAASTAGTYNVTYTIAAAGGCAAFSTTANVTISAAPSATISYAGSPYCGSSGTATVTQTGTPGGTYSSTTGLSINATTGAINLATSTPGTYAVTYTIPAANGCALFTATASVTLTISGTWTGVTSTDWNTASNWCGGIPSAATDAVIPSTAPNMPNIANGAGSVRNITINTGGTLTIGSGGVLDLYGNINGAGTFTAASGSINFRGSTSQSVPAFTATNVTMNGAGGNSGVTLNGNISITGTLTLTNGNITLGSNSLTLANSTNGTMTSHIITNGSGNVIAANLAASQTRVIPIGNDASGYNPVTLTANPGHTTDNFMVRVQQGVYENGVSGTTFTTHVADRMWIINEAAAGGSNVNMMVQWAGSQELSSFDRSKNYVMQHNGTAWVEGTPAAAGGTDPYTQTKANVTSFGAFAVETERIPQPVTGIYPNPASDYIYVVTDLLSTGPVAFSIYDDKGTLVYRKQLELTVGLNQTRLDIGHLSAGVYMIRVTTRLNEKFLSQRFLKVN